MGEAAMEGLSDRGSTPLSSIDVIALRVLVYEAFRVFFSKKT
jgi:hypothetical protein